MTVVSLDQITKDILLKRGLGLHWYMQFMVYAAAGFRELCLDEDVQGIRYKVLPLRQDTDGYNVASLPADYVDWAKVSVRIGQYLHPLVEDRALDLVPNYDSNFEVQPYASGVQSQSSSEALFGYNAPNWWMVNTNAFGEDLGRQFGGVGGMADTFKIDKARNEIKINEDLTSVTEIVLEYISNGMDADSASHIDAYAQSCIEAFAMWQYKLHSRSYGDGEAQRAYNDYVSERGILRARLSDLTMEKLKRIVQSNSIRTKY